MLELIGCYVLLHSGFSSGCVILHSLFLFPKKIPSEAVVHSQHISCSASTASMQNALGLNHSLLEKTFRGTELTFGIG